jgi:hypothetical protein
MNIKRKLSHMILIDVLFMLLPIWTILIVGDDEVSMDLTIFPFLIFSDIQNCLLNNCEYINIMTTNNIVILVVITLLNFAIYKEPFGKDEKS